MEDVYYQSAQRVRVLEKEAHVFTIEDLSTKAITYLPPKQFHELFEPMFNTEDYMHLKEHIHVLNTQLKQLRRANSKQKSELRALRRQAHKARKEEEARAKPHYKNGKRGTNKNG